MLTRSLTPSPLSGTDHVDGRGERVRKVMGMNEGGEKLTLILIVLRVC